MSCSLSRTTWICWHVLPARWSSSRTQPEWRQQWRVERGSSSLTGCRRTAGRYWPTAGWGSTPRSPPPRSQSRSWNRHKQFFSFTSSAHKTPLSFFINPAVKSLPSIITIGAPGQLAVSYLPTSSSSFSVARGRCFFQMSMVKSVELLLKMEVSDDIRAAIMTAIIRPRKPGTHTHTHTLTYAKQLTHLEIRFYRGFRNESMFSPLGMSSMTSVGKAMLEHPTSAPHTRTHSSGSTHPTESETWGSHRSLTHRRGRQSSLFHSCRIHVPSLSSLLMR